MSLPTWCRYETRELGPNAWIAPCGLIALKPGGTSWEVAGAFAVPALTAEQVLSEALGVVDGDVLVVHGAGGVTGGMLVTLGALKGARVIATTAPKSVDHVRWLGASDVLDYDDPDWPDKVRRLTESGAHGSRLMRQREAPSRWATRERTHLRPAGN